MADNNIATVTSWGNSGGVTLPIGKKLGRINKFFITPTSQYFATEAAANTKTNWDAEVIKEKSTRMFPSPLLNVIEDKSEEGGKYKEYPAGGGVRTGNGKVEYLFTCKEINAKDWLKWFTHNDRPCRVYFYDDNLYMRATKNGATVRGFLVDTIEVYPMKETDGATEPSNEMKIRIVLADRTELTDDSKFVYFNTADATVAWNATDIVGLIDVNLALVGTALTTGLTFTAKCDGTTDQYMKGAVKADFVFTITSSGVVVTASTLVDTVTPGTYVVVGTFTQVAHTMTMVDADSLATPGYEALATMSFTPSAP